MKRLLVFTGWYPKPKRPEETPFVSQQVKIMKEFLPHFSGENWEIVVWCELMPTDIPNRIIRQRNPFNEQWQDEGIKVVFRQSTILSHRLTVNQQWLRFPAMKKTFEIIQEHLGGPPDVVWTVTLSSAILWNSFQRRLGISIPFFLQEHSVPLSMHLRTKNKQIQGVKLAKVINRVVVVAERQIEEFKELSRLYEPAVIWNAVDEVFLEIAKGKVQKNQLYFAGRLSKQKGLSTFLKGFKEVLQDYPQLIFNIIGDGDLKPALEQEIQKLQLRDHVSFLGIKTPKEISKLLDQAYLFILPSEYENCPVALLEAQVKGVPSLVRINNASEKVLLPKNGIAVKDNGDGKGLATGLRRILQEYDFYDREQIRTRSIKEFAPSVFANKMYQVLKRIQS